MSLKFGDQESIRQVNRSRRKRPKELEHKVPEGENTNFPLCKDCSKRGLEEIVTAPEMFKIICEECKERYCEIANKTFVIGRIITPIKTI